MAVDKANQKKYLVKMHLAFEYRVFADTPEEANEKATNDFYSDCDENEDMTSNPEIDSTTEEVEFKGLCDCCGVELTPENKINDYLCKACEGH